LKEKYLYFRGEPARFDRQVHHKPRPVGEELHGKGLMKELEGCRRDGFTLELGETRPWLNTVTSTVFGLNGITIGYIVIRGLFSV